MKENNSKVYQAALYLRLSKEDGDVEDGGKLVSNSISNQKDLIMDYLRSHPEIEVHSVWADDGYSGVNFNRPNFQKMLEEIKCGDVDCVIVKDLSRFGREYIESGRYIEKIFPALGVRFIAVTDNYDSADRVLYNNDMLVPFKNLINDAYCRDISIKIRSNLDMKRKRGEFIGAFAVYGYLKDEKDKNKLVVDEYAGGVVRDIFRMKICGMNQQAIADWLNHQGILCPLEYKRSIGIKLQTSFQKSAKSAWTYMAVARILKNEVYTGVLIQGRQTTPNYKVKTRVVKAESEWIRIENTHEPIIDKFTFRLVQILLKLDTRISPKQPSLYPLSGFLYCGDCGEPMVRKTVNAGGKRYVYYVCSGNKKDKTACVPHCIREDVLKETILKMVQGYVREVIGLNGALKMIGDAPGTKMEILKYQKRIDKKREEITKAEIRKENLYDDLKDGIISKEEYMQLKQEYDRRIAEAEKAAAACMREQDLIIDNRGSLSEWTEHFRQYGNIGELDRNVVALMVEKVFVYSSERIEVVFNFRDEFETAMQYIHAEKKDMGVNHADSRKEAV